MRRTLVLAITLVAGLASAHVAPSVDDNNRYLKLTPQRDRVRLAYTVFFGENPGASMRPGLDANRDGTIADAEAQTFGDRLAGEVAGALEITLDGAPTRVEWAEVIVGLGSPSVRAGSFSVDLIAYLCLASDGGRHTLALRDRFRIPRPGETEVRVEDMHGVTIETARIGALADPSRLFKFAGPGGPLSDDGLDLAFVAGPEAPTGTTACAVRRRPTSAGDAGLPVVPIAAGVVLVVGAIAVVAWRRRRRAR